MTVFVLTACGTALDSTAPGREYGVPSEPGDNGPVPIFVDNWVQVVPRASCGAGSLPETALQGQVPLEDRVSGRNKQGYRCNLELVGQYQGEGASWQHAWYDDCAYFDQAYNLDGLEHPGTVVIDASDPANPRAVKWLDTIAMLDPWEGLKVSEQRALLMAINAHDGSGGPEIDVYDLQDDCRDPKLLFSGMPMGANPAATLHGGHPSPDGTLFYATPFTPPLYVYDIEDPQAPSMLSVLPYMAHDLTLNDAGTRAYLAQSGLGQNQEYVTIPPRNGLVILDTTQVQAHTPGAVARPLSALYWNDGGVAQETVPATIAGKPYVIFVDEFGSGGPFIGNPSTACAQGLSPFGFARIIDISDEVRPVVISKIMLEVNDPANCDQTVQDHPGDAFGYDNHYCEVDDPHDATALACSHLEAGLRIFDIRDPVHPREIAYYNPPSQMDRKDSLPAAQNRPGGATSFTDGNMTADWTTANPRWVRERNEIWFTSQDNGFQVVRFTNGAYPLDD